MTINHFLESIAETLRTLWPNRHVFTDEIPKDADGNFYVRVIDSAQSHELDRRFKRGASFEVLYFRDDKDAMGFLDFSETMYDNFRILRVVNGGARRGVHLRNQAARANSGAHAYQFTFDVDFIFWEVEGQGDKMDALNQNTATKEA